MGGPAVSGPAEKGSRPKPRGETTAGKSTAVSRAARGGRAGRAAGATANPASLPAPGSGAAWPAFWLPAGLRARLIDEHTHWREVSFAQGRLCGTDCEAATPGSVTARWPELTRAEWAEVVSELRTARESAPRGQEYWARLRAALGAAARRLSDPADPYHAAVMQAVPGYTGYAPGMIAAALGSPELWDAEGLTHALRFQPDKVCSARWRGIPGLPGRVRFFPTKAFDKLAGWIPVAWEMPLYGVDHRPEAVAAFGDGHIPGSSLQTVILALAATLRGEAPLPRPVPPPAVLLRDSIREPLLTPLVLSAIEEYDPEVVSMVASGVWGEDDPHLERQILGEADVVLGEHGHKVGFTVISREALEVHSVVDAQGWTPPGGAEIIDIVALLAGLDTAFWDQRGSLSSRVHFVERGGPADDLPAEYARRLTKRLRQIAGVIPRGAWPLRRLHDAFDRYKAIEGSDRWGSGLRVVSDYDDPFVVVLDDRMGREARLDRNVFRSMLDDCQTRVVMVRPVDDIMELPWRYLGMVPERSLQSVSVAMGRPGQGMTKQVLDFATACGLRGVTSVRVAGRGPFPQPAYSWDGRLPLDLVGRRPPGYFTTIEFDSPFDDMMETYRAHVGRLAQLPPVDTGGMVAPL